MKLGIAIGAIWRRGIQHTLTHEASEGLADQVHVHVPGGFGEESRIEKVHHRMFDTTYVEVYPSIQ